MKKYAAIAFDIDGTLYSERLLYLRLLSMKFALSHIRLIRDFSAVRRRLRTPAQATSDEPGVDTSLPIQAQQAELLAQYWNATVRSTRELIERVIYRDWMELTSRTPLFPGTRRLLGELRRRGTRVAVLSDFPTTRKLAAWGIAGYFEHAICSEDTGALKPAAKPFQVLQDSLGLGAPDILYIGNSYSNDICGAGGVSMDSIHLTNTPGRLRPSGHPRALHTCTSFAEIIKLLVGE